MPGQRTKSVNDWLHQLGIPVSVCLPTTMSTPVPSRVICLYPAAFSAWHAIHVYCQSVKHNARGGGWVYAQGIRSVTRGGGGGYVSVT